jgi:putative spermidine/putrescine transport system permease protein
MLRGAAAAAHAAAAAPDAGSGVALRRALRRSQRREQWRAALLVLPLFVFIVACFVVPIGAMLSRGVVDTDVTRILPDVTAALKDWDGHDVPPDTAFAALVRDIHAARAAGTLSSAATRLNYDIPGFRTLLFATGRALPAEVPGSPREALIAIDPKWSERATWAAIRRAGGPVTDFYLLGALDLRRDADGSIVGAPSEERVFRAVLGRTLWIAGVVTLACLLLGYPVALVIARQPPQRAAMLLFLVLLPFWTSLLVRTVAWVVLLQREGVLNNLLMSLSIINEPAKMIYNRFAVYVAMVHVLLPFMVLPLYSVMRGIPPTYLRAAWSLGATPWTAFRRVYMPQTMPGIAAGCLMVFIQALGYYITPALVGGADDQMISYFIAFYASRTVNWGMAAALSIMLLASTLVLYAVYNRMIGVERMRLA